MYHPDLNGKTRWLPHGVGRQWALPLLKRLPGWLLKVAAGSRPEVALDGCSVFVYRPEAQAGRLPGLVWMHGGGLLFGDARQDEVFLKRVANELGVVVASVQYRCAPEHPFPTPLRDCEQAFDWLAQQADVDPARLMVGGASAGGGLAAALCLLLRDRGGLQPGFQLLVYPMLDDRSADVPHDNDPHFRVWDRPSNALGWGSYLQGHSRAAPPSHAVPARAEDLSGLPPAWIGVGTLDLFHDEDRAYADRLRAAGGGVTLEIVEGAYHGFDAVDSDTPVARGFMDAQLSALAAHLGQPR